MRLRLPALLVGLLLSGASACYRYVTTTRPLTAADCPPDDRPKSFARSRPDSTVSGIIHGRVIYVEATDSARQPIQGAMVHIEGTQQGAYTDAAGQFLISRVAPGRYSVTTRRVGFELRRDSVVVGATTGTRLDVGLRASILDGCPGFMALIERKRVWRWPWQRVRRSGGVARWIPFRALIAALTVPIALQPR